MPNTAKLTKEIWYNGQDGVRQFMLKLLIDSGRDFDLIDGNIVCLDLKGVP